MLKNLVYKLATLLDGAAVLSVRTASFLYVNQPETPKELLK
ncbi:cyclic lactone autoinducer peptide [Paenibacillus sp. FSL H8-0537]